MSRKAIRRSTKSVDKKQRDCLAYLRRLFHSIGRCLLRNCLQSSADLRTSCDFPGWIPEHIARKSGTPERNVANLTSHWPARMVLLFETDELTSH
jgi:hypothetical protein